MLHVRPMRWPEDREPLRTLDASFTTDRVYHVVATDTSFELVEQIVMPPVRKAYTWVDELDALDQHGYVAIAEVDARVVGMAALKHEAWNRRAVVWHLYVDVSRRGRGVGRALIEHLVGIAQDWQARCLWLETQDVNYPAIQAYRRLGFQLCGLDITLYDPAGPEAQETALFFVRQLG